jgi:hypothetical protein
VATTDCLAWVNHYCNGNIHAWASVEPARLNSEIKTFVVMNIVYDYLVAGQV